MSRDESSQTQVPTRGPAARALVLDATPLITQHVSTLQSYASEFYTTPTVYSEIKDEAARNNLLLWGEKLIQRHPKAESIKKVEEFSKLTGDYTVLSANDIHIIALTYELEVELNGGDWRLRKYPGEKLTYNQSFSKAECSSNSHQDNTGAVDNSQNKQKKPRRRGGKRQREKAALRKSEAGEENVVSETREKDKVDKSSDEEMKETVTKLDQLQIAPQSEAGGETEPDQTLDEEYDETDDCGEWISEENLLQEMIKDSGERTEENKPSKIKVALATGDFAVQNVSLQIGLNLMNTLSGLQIKTIRNYMLRCHACFTMLHAPKDGRPKHFCPRCGGNTLLRCAVSVNAKTGVVTPHLKTNFQWVQRGLKYSIASPLSKATQKRMGNKGFVHNKSNKQKEYDEPLLREDQKEYESALKQDDWLRRHNEKILDDWIGGGSADNFISPFVVQGIRPTGVKIGKGRYANSSRRKR